MKMKVFFLHLCLILLLISPVTFSSQYSYYLGDDIVIYYDEHKANNCNLPLSKYNKIISASNNSPLDMNLYCGEYNFSEKDNQIIFELLNISRPDRITLYKQSDEGYSRIIFNIENIYSSKCSYEEVILNGRKEEWTSISTFQKRFCKVPFFCEEGVPLHCQTGLMFLCLYIAILVIVLSLISIIVRRFNKKNN